MSLTASEIDSAVVVEKIPLAEQQQTEDALMVNFSTYGQIIKMTLQQVQETQTQTAVIVYATEEASIEVKSNANTFSYNLYTSSYIVFILWNSSRFIVFILWYSSQSTAVVTGALKANF